VGPDEKEEGRWAVDVSDEGTLRKFQKELNAGTVSLVLLAILDRSTEPLYGYQIAKSIEGGWQEGAPVKQGTLYPVLRSMEEQGLLGSRVEPSVSGPPRKYYTITDRGRAVLIDWKSAWERTSSFVDETLEGRNGA
jgi:PadR family transcriptional regulator PadR